MVSTSDGKRSQAENNSDSRMVKQEIERCSNKYGKKRLRNVPEILGNIKEDLVPCVPKKFINRSCILSIHQGRNPKAPDPPTRVKEKKKIREQQIKCESESQYFTVQHLDQIQQHNMSLPPINQILSGKLERSIPKKESCAEENTHGDQRNQEKLKTNIENRLSKGIVSSSDKFFPVLYDRKASANFVTGMYFFGLQEFWMQVIDIEEKRVEKEELKETGEKSLTDAAKVA
ncbi:hypothetical protein RDI58_013227 [Solanum bulbocastanum]|uniref:Uncharacterized protein n=1 Tax=Solanum bulbocastanum TaxID=147425 RepID=A0AAN8TRA3_SOLBU